MQTSKFFFIIFLILSLCQNKFLFSQYSLNTQIINIIDEVVCEVVVLKPTNDSLSYEKPIPFDLLPYKIRNDKYYSIGTAFAITKSLFVSAAHLFNFLLESGFKNVLLRDKKGNIYEVNEVARYSNYKDFIIFTVKNKTAATNLKINYNPVFNEKVFTVGNALGEGIIIRDGILTSKTPEAEKGEWEWLRFSAAVSPGNSGGPLLDKDGNIIGVISQKSQNENLNYAVPFSIIKNAEKNKAYYHLKTSYRLPNTSKVKNSIFDYSVEIPKKIEELQSAFIDQYKIFSTNQLFSLIAENKNFFFPNSKSSLKLLNKCYYAVFPDLICEGEDGNWDAFTPSKTERAELNNNGYLSYGNLCNMTLINFQKPDDVLLESVYNDSKLIMDMILKGLPLYRYIMNEKIRIISLGKAKEEYSYMDNYKRKWFIKTWSLEYEDLKLVAFSLPVPNGFIAISKIEQTGAADIMTIPDIKVLADYIYLTYYGSFKNWTEFLKNKANLPEIFSTIEFSYNKSEAHFKTKRISFRHTSDSFEISDKSDMALYFTYYTENNQIIWDIRRVEIGDYKGSKNYLVITKELKPIKELDESFQINWEKICRQKFPFNKKSFFEKGTTSISGIHSKYNDLEKKNITQLCHIET